MLRELFSHTARRITPPVAVVVAFLKQSLIKPALNFSLLREKAKNTRIVRIDGSILMTFSLKALLENRGVEHL